MKCLNRTTSAFDRQACLEFKNGGQRPPGRAYGMENDEPGRNSRPSPGVKAFAILDPEPDCGRHLHLLCAKRS